MASSNGFGGIDMNNMATLGRYSQMLLFKNDTSQRELLFYHPSSEEQRILQSLAHNLELEYEYTAALQTARIIRSIAAQMSIDGFQYFNFDEDIHSSRSPETNNEGNLDIVDFVEGIHSPMSAQRSANTELMDNTTNLMTTSPPTHTTFSTGSINADSFLINSIDIMNPFDMSALEPNIELIHRNRSSQPSNSRGCEISSAPTDAGPFHPPTPRRDSSVFDGSIGPASYTPSKLSSRKGSMNSNASAGYKEIVFDSNSIYSDGQVSNASAGSGRRGPLTEIARAGMNAVKQVGACWRCKFLRNKCNAELPCALCPSGEKSKWAAVGCRRGKVDENLHPVDICIPPLALLQLRNPIRPSEQEASDLANRIFRLGCERRETWLLQTSTPGGIGQDTRQLFLSNIANQAKKSSNPPNTASLQPLQDCILAIVWELLERPLSLPVIDSNGTFDMLSLLLPSAAIYQATCETDQLIAQSLICLRSCLEVLRVQVSGTLSSKSHQNCSSFCKVQCALNLNENCSLYLKEVNRVFFKKENLRDRNRWWLSTFYSFCIQALVRKALIKIMQDPSVVDPEDYKPPEPHTSYMHLPVRLFIASCANYDLMVYPNLVQHESLRAMVEQDWVYPKIPEKSIIVDTENQAKRTGTTSVEDVLAARLAVAYANWASSGSQSVQQSRVWKACIPCRRRKIKCVGNVDNPNDSSCPRCQRAGIECFFSTGITNSYDYLRTIFEDNGNDIKPISHQKISPPETRGKRPPQQKEREKRKRTNSQNSQSKLQPDRSRFLSLFEKTARAYSERSS